MPYPTDNPYAQDMGLGAYFGGAQLANNNQAQGLDIQHAGLANMFQDLQNQRYQQTTPYEVAQQAGAAARQPGLLEQLNQSNTAAQLQNAFTSATQPGKIESTNQENKQKFSADYLKDQLSKTDNLMAAYQSGGGPGFIQAAQDLKVPQERVMQMIQSGDVLGSLQQHRDMTNQMLASTPASVDEERKLSLKHIQEMNLADKNNAAALERAKVMANARVDAVQAKGTNQKPLNSDQFFTQLVQEKVANGEIDPQMAAETLARFKAASAQQQPALVNGGIGTQGQTGNIIPPMSNKPTQAHGLADVQKMYPGVPAEKLKEAYKKKFGVDLQ